MCHCSPDCGNFFDSSADIICPDDPPDNNLNGYNFWLNKLNQFNGNFVNADMVKAFIKSTEYRRRFGPP
jgi:hypothetical protein